MGGLGGHHHDNHDQGRNSNRNEVAPADQVKEKNEMRQDGLFGNLFKMGKKLLPKVLGHAGHHHDNHDQEYNDEYDQPEVKEKSKCDKMVFSATSLKWGKSSCQKSWDMQDITMTITTRTTTMPMDTINNLERICIFSWLPLAKEYLPTSTLALRRVRNDDERNH